MWWEHCENSLCHCRGAYCIPRPRSNRKAKVNGAKKKHITSALSPSKRLYVKKTKSSKVPNTPFESFSCQFHHQSASRGQFHREDLKVKSDLKKSSTLEWIPSLTSSTERRCNLSVQTQEKGQGEQEGKIQPSSDEGGASNTSGRAIQHSGTSCPNLRECNVKKLFLLPSPPLLTPKKLS